MLSCLLAVGALLFGLSFMSPAVVEPVGKVSSPSVAKAPAPVERAAAEEPEEEPEEKEDESEEPKEEEPAEQEEPAEPEQASVPAPSGTDLYLTVPKMGLYDDYVINDASEQTLLNGAGKVPETGFPWEDGANTYIASHVLGYAGSGSYMHFAELVNVVAGDEVILKDTNGTTYTYRVFETLTVTPYDVWVLDPVAGKDMVSLQTCVNPPAYDMRFIVRAERVGVDAA